MKRLATIGEALSILSARAGDMDEKAAAVAGEIIAEVRARGDAALLDYGRKFDCPTLDRIAVPREEIEKAFKECDAEFLSTLEASARNIRAFHEKQRQNGFCLTDKPGQTLGMRVLPLDTVGVYVPGGTARYPSTVLMDALPARIAGVRRIVMTTPAGRDGKIPSDVLAAAYIAGVDEIYAVGGAQAVAALAYGTESVPQVDKIVGPGNRYVAAAKKLVSGRVAIDSIAGPSEILIISDGTGEPAWAAADMLGQAEHDALAAPILITTSLAFADEVEKEAEKRLSLLPRREIAQRSMEDYGLVLVADSLESAADFSNLIAPEHLELFVEDPFSLLPLIKNAGSVFLGRYAPEALGDYFAGANHTLPTFGTARFSSPLSVDDFIKKQSFIYYDRAALAQAREHVTRFAAREGLDAHARSVDARFEEENA